MGDSPLDIYFRPGICFAGPTNGKNTVPYINKRKAWAKRLIGTVEIFPVGEGLDSPSMGSKVVADRHANECLWALPLERTSGRAGKSMKALKLG